MNQVLMNALMIRSRNHTDSFVINRNAIGCHNPAHIAREFSADCIRAKVVSFEIDDERKVIPIRAVK